MKHFLLALPLCKLGSKLKFVEFRDIEVWKNSWFYGKDWIQIPGFVEKIGKFCMSLQFQYFMKHILVWIRNRVLINKASLITSLKTTCMRRLSFTWFQFHDKITYVYSLSISWWENLDYISALMNQIAHRASCVARKADQIFRDAQRKLSMKLEIQSINQK